ncbi:hypothetical protein QT971_28345 [Microcoleus sp. herbarium19]|uniref:hypothetical protein n=1 Tax=unclassified Microcoleus TaxID=2642155 RepID=UPI002FD27B41
MSKSIVELVDNLPSGGVTVMMLKSLDFVVPGEWNNLTGFDNTIQAVTGETKRKVVDKIRDRAIALYENPNEPYQAAVGLYQIVDRADTALAASAVANKIGQKIGFLSFLGNLTPKADVTQTLDLCIKVVVELIALCKLNNISLDNIGSFGAALSDYKHESIMRMAALVCVDGLIPLGPDFIKKAQSTLAGLNPGTLQQNSTFQSISNLIPGGSVGDKLGFITATFGSTQGWMNNLVRSRGLTPESILRSMNQYIDIADNKLDYVAAFLDMTTNYYEHTGIQTVARRLVDRAYAEIGSGRY